MTDEPTDDLEQRLRRDLDEIADAVPLDEPPSGGTNVVPLADASERHRRPVLAIAGVVGAAAALLIGVLIWQKTTTVPAGTWQPGTPPPSRSPPRPRCRRRCRRRRVRRPRRFLLDGGATSCPMLPVLDGSTVGGVRRWTSPRGNRSVSRSGRVRVRRGWRRDLCRERDVPGGGGASGSAGDRLRRRAHRPGRAGPAVVGGRRPGRGMDPGRGVRHPRDLGDGRDP